jgi:hypothetical protein
MAPTHVAWCMTFESSIKCHLQFYIMVIFHLMAKAASNKIWYQHKEWSITAIQALEAVD